MFVWEFGASRAVRADAGNATSLRLGQRDMFRYGGRRAVVCREGSNPVISGQGACPPDTSAAYISFVEELISRSQGDAGASACRARPANPGRSSLTLYLFNRHHLDASLAGNHHLRGVLRGLDSMFGKLLIRFGDRLADDIMNDVIARVDAHFGGGPLDLDNPGKRLRVYHALLSARIRMLFHEDRGGRS